MRSLHPLARYRAHPETMMGRVAANFGRLARCGSVPISVAISEQKHNAANDQKARNTLGVRHLGHLASSFDRHSPISGDAPHSLLAICPNCLSRGPS